MMIKTIQMRFYLILLALLPFSASFSQKTIVLHGTPDWNASVDISDSVRFYQDKEWEALTLAQVQALQTFRPFSEKRNERTTASDVAVMRTWLTFTIQNTHQTDTAKMIYWVGAHAGVLLYHDSKQIFRAGFKVVPEGYVPNVSFLDINIPPLSTQTFWLQVIDYEISAMPIAAQLHTQHTGTRLYALSETSYRLLFLIMSILIGCLLFMTLYSLYHFWLTRDLVFGYYSLYVGTATIVTWLGTEGRFQMFYLTNLFLTHGKHEKNFEVITFNFIVPIFYILFVSKIAEIPKNFPRIWLVLQGAVAILIAQQLLSMYQSYTNQYFYSNIYYLNKNLVALGATFLLFYGVLRGRSPIKNYLIVGISCFILLVFVPLFLNFSV